MDKKIERHYELSKSQYVKGVTCYKKLWLRNNLDRKLATPPSEFQEHLFTQGHEVGDLARTFFPGGELIHEGSEAALEAVEHTKRALQNKIPCIFEAAFIFDEILVRVDVLRRNQDGSFDLIEVKSTTSVKDHHLDDISIQRYVVENLGFKISNAIIMHLNNEYVRQGQLDIQKLFLLTPRWPPQNRPLVARVKAASDKTLFC